MVLIFVIAITSRNGWCSRKTRYNTVTQAPTVSDASVDLRQSKPRKSGFGTTWLYFLENFWLQFDPRYGQFILFLLQFAMPDLFGLACYYRKNVVATFG